MGSVNEIIMYMRKYVIGAAILGASAILFLVLTLTEPKHQGRTISAWQDDWASKKAQGFPAALQHIGTNALPNVVRNLALNDSTWHRKYSSLRPKLPNLLQRLFPKPKPCLDDGDAYTVFYNLGSNSIPCAIALLKHDSPTVRRAAAMGLAQLRKEYPAANQAIPALIEALSDADKVVRNCAAITLKDMGPDASNAVPALVKIVADTGSGPQTSSDPLTRAAAAGALGNMGPAAAAALPTLKLVLRESVSDLRGSAAVAIWRIDSDVDTALPVLLEEIPRVDDISKWDWIVALGEMGPSAKQAAPQLAKELEQHHEKWFLNYVTNALKSIDPEAAAETEVQAR